MLTLNNITTLCDYLDSRGVRYYGDCMDIIRDRENGREFSFSIHLKGLIYSLLSNQTKWTNIEPKLSEVDKLFFNYDYEKILKMPEDYFRNGIFELKCGNMSTKAQMSELGYNIGIFKKIEGEYGSIDNFVESAPAYQIVKLISDSDSHYKLRMVGEALAWEYLRNVGVDGAKPDTHMRRFLGNDRMGTCGHSPATINEVINQVDDISRETGLYKIEIDNIIWSYCADGYGEICTAVPHCEHCVIRDCCKHGRN